ncbi:hypothetical protein TEQG_03775 [Trichophyton equinum CBS 127.97]|uniref:Uncharacterized protein n=1 Tax=Trichophyton equinum (strain ATCC MYA-4606 / CBS 127.97) TaxID=559882 RepID=F2PSR3_TRIEC|nr:hypothetical protein TEQG_03775 [Trichophyton equinum CBS 127.97]
MGKGSLVLTQQSLEFVFCKDRTAGGYPTWWKRYTGVVLQEISNLLLNLSIGPLPANQLGLETLALKKGCLHKWCRYINRQRVVAPLAIAMIRSETCAPLVFDWRIGAPSPGPTPVPAPVPFRL